MWVDAHNGRVRQLINWVDRSSLEYVIIQWEWSSFPIPNSLGLLASAIMYSKSERRSIWKHYITDWTLLVVHSCRSFSTLRRGQWWWWRIYVHSPDGEGRVGVRVGYSEGKFYILFKTGDVLIFGIVDSKAERRMLIADSFHTAQMDYSKVLCVHGSS
ncbi:hypothetical protein LINPERHAP2_LOCUS13840 [Linum perenne]